MAQVCHQLERETAMSVHEPRCTTRVDLSAQMMEQLDLWVSQQGLSRGNVVRQALALYFRVLEASARGERLALVDGHHKVLYEIVLS